MLIFTGLLVMLESLNVF